MATAYKCDRCGKLFERDCKPDLYITRYIHCYGDTSIDLCPKCQSMLEEFVYPEINGR